MQFVLSSYTRTSLRSLSAALRPPGIMDSYLGQSRSPTYIAVSRCFSSDNRSKKPKAVIFDMGGVILPSPLILFAEFESQTGLPKGTLNRLVASGGVEGPWAQLETGTLTLNEFTILFSQQLSKQVGRNIDISPLIARLNFGKSTASPVMIDAINCVRAEGLKTALLTNNWFSDELKSKTFQPLDRSLFDVIVESCVVGCRKPHADIYNRCVGELKVNADETVFLDDIGANLKAAKALGIRTIKVESPEQGVADLEQVLGIPLRGFVPGTTSVPRHLALDSNSLEKYLKSLGLQDSCPPNIRVFEHGQSNPTYFVAYGGRNIVLRKKPPGKLLPSAHAVDREFRVMSAAQKGGVPVPNMIAFCGDESVIGTQFYLMDFVTGRIFKDVRLRELPRAAKRETIMAMIRVLARIHAIDIDRVGLSDYGKKGKFVERNFKRWASQYELTKTHEIPSMTKLMEWLPKHMPQTERVTVVHGDFRLDNLIYYPDKSEVVATIDWELSTLGDPLTDLATCALVYYLPASCPLMFGLADQDISKLDIPTVDEIIAEYCRLCDIPSIDNWDFYITFVLFRMAAILQGVYKRNISGQGSSSIGKIVGAFAETSADIGWRIASQSRLRPTVVASQTSASEPTNTRSYSTLAHRCHQASTVRELPQTTQSNKTGHKAISVEDLSPWVQELYWDLKEFVQEHVVPLDAAHTKRPGMGQKLEVLPEVKEAKARARTARLWNLTHSLEADHDLRHRARLTYLEYAFLCEEIGGYMHGPEVFNFSASDTLSMQVLALFGTVEQKETWLRPLLEGSTRSCFAVAEPAAGLLDAASVETSIRHGESADAASVESSITRNGDHYIVNGRKCFVSGALDPQTRLCVLLGRTNPIASIHLQQSMILIPMDLPGITVIQPLTRSGSNLESVDRTEVLFENVRVPANNILLEEGRGLDIAQGILGPALIQQWMRVVGIARRVLAQMLISSDMGKSLGNQQSVIEDLDRSEAEVDQCTLLVLNTAHRMDECGSQIASQDVAVIRKAVEKMVVSVIDSAVQAHRGTGVHTNQPLAHLISEFRLMKNTGALDQVLLRAVARIENAKSNTSKL